MIDDSSVFPWQKHLSQEDRYSMCEEILNLGAEAYREHQSTTNFAKALEALLVAWKTTAEAQADPEVREVLLSPKLEDFGPVEPPPWPKPVQRHYARYIGARYIDGKGWVNHCGECEQPSEHPNHFFEARDFIRETWEGARFRMGQTLREKTSFLEWHVQGVGEEVYVLRHAHHEPGETWHTYTWDRAAVEALTEPVGECLDPEVCSPDNRCAYCL